MDKQELDDINRDRAKHGFPPVAGYPPKSKLEEVYLQHPGNEELVEEEKKQVPEDKQRMPKTSRLERQLVKPNMGVLAEQGFNYLTSNILQKNIECKVEGFEDTKAKWIVDCIIDTIGRDIDFRELGIQEFSELYVADIDEIKKHPERLAKMPPCILTDDGIRQTIGRPDLRGWQIKEKILQVWKRVNFEGKFECFYANKKWHAIEIHSHLLDDVHIEEDGIASRRKNLRKDKDSRTKHKYICHLGTTFGVIILANLAKGKFKIFPKKFYKMKLGSQEIYRYYSVFKGSPGDVNITPEMWPKILHWKKDVKRPYDRINQVKIYMKELEETMGLKVTRSGKGRKIDFNLKETNQKRLLTS